MSIDNRSFDRLGEPMKVLSAYALTTLCALASTDARAGDGEDPQAGLAAPSLDDDPYAPVVQRPRGTPQPPVEPVEPELDVDEDVGIDETALDDEPAAPPAVDAVAASQAPEGVPRSHPDTEGFDRLARMRAVGSDPRRRDRVKRDYDHRGFVADVGLGPSGCTGPLCRRHGAGAGAGGHAYVGGNLGGRVGFGAEFAWSEFTARLAEGTTVPQLYGISTSALEPFVTRAQLEAYDVSAARLNSLRAGPSLRVHVLRRGPVAAWGSVGVGYQRFAARYATGSGNVRMIFQGLDVPAQIGLLGYVHEHVALGLIGRYAWSWFATVNLQSDAVVLTAPLSVLDAGRDASDETRSDLPNVWGADASVRITF